MLCLFYNSKNLNCIGALSFLQFEEFELYWGAVFLRLEEEYWRSPFYDSKRSIGEVLFFNQFYSSDF